MVREKVILLVEDNHIIQKCTAKCFTLHDCQVTTAETEKFALHCVQTTSFDLILMDIGLPDGSGWNVIEAVRSKPNGCNLATPIVIISAHMSEEEKRTLCDRWKVSMAITKPFRYEQIPLLLSLMT